MEPDEMETREVGDATAMDRPALLVSEREVDPAEVGPEPGGPQDRGDRGRREVEPLDRWNVCRNRLVRVIGRYVETPGRDELVDLVAELGGNLVVRPQGLFEIAGEREDTGIDPLESVDDPNTAPGGNCSGRRYSLLWSETMLSGTGNRELGSWRLVGAGGDDDRVGLDGRQPGLPGTHDDDVVLLKHARQTALSPQSDHAGFAVVLAGPAPFLATPEIWQSDGTSTYSLASSVDLDLSEVDHLVSGPIDIGVAR
jgi:hypothetical protein